MRIYKFSNCYVDNNEKERKRPNARIRERRQANKGMRKQSYINTINLFLYKKYLPLTFKLSFEHFDFNDEEFLNDLKRINNFYDNFVVLEYKENKKKY